MSGMTRYKDLFRHGEIKQFRELPVETFTIREIAELLREGYIYPFYFQGRYCFKAGLGAEDI